MEAVFRDDVSGEKATYEVSETATAAELLQEVCRLFGREELDSALEVDGAVVCTGVVGGVSGGEASVGSLGVHSDSRLVLCRSRDRVLARVAKWKRLHGYFTKDRLPEWAWDDEEVVFAAVVATDQAFDFVSNRLRNSDSFMRAAAARDGRMLCCASAELRAEKRVVMAAVATYGHSLRFASDALKDDREVVLAAIANYRYAILLASKRLRADKELGLAACAPQS